MVLMRPWGDRRVALGEHRYRTRDGDNGANGGGDRMSELPFKRRDLLKLTGSSVTFAGVTSDLAVAQNEADGSDVTPLPPILDISTSDETTVEPGDTLSVNISVENHTEDPQFLRLVYPDVLPCCWYFGICTIEAPEPEIGTEYIISRTDDGGDWNKAAFDHGEWVWESMDSGSSVNPRLKFEIPDSLESGSHQITLGAQWACEDIEGGDDPREHVSIDEIEIEVSKPDPELEITAEGDETTPGGEATVEFTLSNDGEATAEDLGIQLGGTPVFDPDWEFVEVWGTPATVGELIEHPDAGVFAVSDGFWDVSDLDPGESQTLTITFEAPDDVEPGEYEVEGYELDEPNVEATAVIEVSPGSEVDAEITLLDIEQEIYEPGDELIKEVLVENTGGTNYEFAIVSFLFPPEGPDLSLLGFVTLEQGVSDTFLISAGLPEDIPEGTYDAAVVVIDPTTEEMLDEDIWEDAFEVERPEEFPTERFLDLKTEKLGPETETSSLDKSSRYSIQGDYSSQDDTDDVEESVSAAIGSRRPSTPSDKQSVESGDEDTEAESISPDNIEQGLAPLIDDLSVNDLGDEELAQETVSGIEDAVEDEALSPETAEEALERLILGERVTEQLLRVIGPAEVEGDEDYHLAGITREQVFKTAISIALMKLGAEDAAEVLGLSEGLAKILESLAKDVVKDFLETALASEIVDDAYESVEERAEKIHEEIVDGEHETDSDVEEAIETEVSTILTEVIYPFRTRVETGQGFQAENFGHFVVDQAVNVERTLEGLHNEMSASSLEEDGLAGTLTDAESFAEDSQDLILYTTKWSTQAVSLLASVADLMSIITITRRLIVAVRDFDPGFFGLSDADSVKPQATGAEIVAAVKAGVALMQAVAIISRSLATTIGDNSMRVLTGIQWLGVRGVQSGGQMSELNDFADEINNFVEEISDRTEQVQEQVNDIADGTVSPVSRASGPSESYIVAADLLNQLENALLAEDFDAVIDFADELSAAYLERQEDERRAIRRSLMVGDKAEVEFADSLVVGDHAAAGSAVRSARMSLLMSLFPMSVEEVEPDNDHIAEALGAIDFVREVETVFDERGADAEDVTEVTEVPAAVSILDIAAARTVGESERAFDISIQVGNIGDTDADDVEVEIEPSDGLTVDVEEAWIGTLESGSEQTVETSVAPEEPGRQRVIVRIGSDDAGSDSALLNLRVDEPDDPAVADYTNEDGIVETGSLRDAIDDWRGDEIDTDLLRDVIDAWRSGEPIE